MVIRIINRLEEAFICLLLASMTLLVFAEVFFRYVLHEGIDWAQETTLNLSAWMVLFGASYGVKLGSHIGVDALVKLFPRFWQRMIGLFAVLLCLIYCTMFIMGSWEYLNLLYMIGITLEDLPVPKWLAFSVLLIGFVLLAMRLLVVGWRIATNQSCGFKLADEARESMHLIHKEEEHDAYQGRECPVDTEEKPRGDVK